MAEQTVILALSSYDKCCFALAQNPSRQGGLSMLISRFSFLHPISIQAAQSAQWIFPHGDGCNMESPIFHDRFSRQISCIRMHKRGRPYTIYRSLVRFQTSANKHRHSLGYYDDGKVRGLGLIIPEDTSIGLPSNPEGYLVFEIMDDGKPHKKPWVGVPSVGLFEDFDRASSLGIRFEWFSTDRWLSIGIHREAILKTALASLDGSSVEPLITMWRIAMNIIQALEGIVYTNPGNGFHAHVNFGAIKIMELHVDHMSQVFSWSARPSKEMTIPKKASWQDNFTAMVHQFSSPTTLIGPIDAITFDTDGYRMEWIGGLRPLPQCDFCILTQTRPHMGCEQTVGPYGSICTPCSLLNRPCTWTFARKLPELWGQEPPIISTSKNYELSQFPTGPFRYLTYHRIQSEGVQEVLAPFEKNLGLFMGGKPTGLDDDGIQEMED
jgi:hypothetical protein